VEDIDIISKPHLEEMAEHFEEEYDEMDERNDVYTAKGGQGLTVPVTVKSQSSLRGGVGAGTPMMIVTEGGGPPG
jgi:hypothetical protein